MPLQKGSSKKVVSKNISEFHTGKTYANTKAKFGKKKADAQAVAVALSTARKYGKRAKGGAVKKKEKAPSDAEDFQRYFAGRDWDSLHHSSDIEDRRNDPPSAQYPAPKLTLDDLTQYYSYPDSSAIGDQLGGQNIEAAEYPNPTFTERFDGQFVPKQWGDEQKGLFHGLEDKAAGIRQGLPPAFADGGDVGPDSDSGESWTPGEDDIPIATDTSPRIGQPDLNQVDWSRAKDWLMMNHPTGELKPAEYTPSQRLGNVTQDALMGLGAQPNVARHLTEGVGGILSNTPISAPVYAADLTYAKQHDDPWGAAQAAMGFMPGFKGAKGLTAKGAEIADDIAKTVLGASWGTAAQHPESEAVAKTLKSFYPKDIAASAHYLGLPQDEVANLKTYMSPGAAEAFDKHYAKLQPKAKPQVGPQATDFPDVKVPESAPSAKAKPTSPSEHQDMDEILKAIEGALKGQEPEIIPPPAKEIDPYDKKLKLPPDFYLAETEKGSGLWAVKKEGKSPDLHYTWSADPHDAVNYFYEQYPHYQQYQHVEIKPKAPKPLEPEFVSTEPSTGPEWEPGPEDYESIEPEHTGVSKPAIKSSSGYPQLPNHWKANEDFDSHVRALIQKHFDPVDWQKFNPRKYTSDQIQSMQRVPITATNDRIRELGGRPDLPLWKGGNLTDYPAEIPHPLEKVAPNIGGPPKEKFEKAFFTADNPYVAQMYGKASPYVALTKNPVLQADFTDLASKFGRHQGFSNVASYDPIMTKYIIDSAREQGADMVLLHNMRDLGGIQTQYAVLNPHILRAPHAKFDPKKLHLRHPLAGLVGGGLLSYGAFQGGEDEDHMAKGGKIKHKQIDENPQDHEFIDFSRGGLIDSDIPGRTDKIPMKVKTGAFVLPADIPSALGQGNSKAGAEILKKMFTHGAYGLPPPHIHGREFHYPHWISLGHHKEAHHHKAKGGEVEKAPIIAAGGEFIVDPDVVKAIGHGDIGKGHKVLTKFVLHTRKQHIATLKKLKSPK